MVGGFEARFEPPTTSYPSPTLLWHVHAHLWVLGGASQWVVHSLSPNLAFLFGSESTTLIALIAILSRLHFIVVGATGKARATPRIAVIKLDSARPQFTRLRKIAIGGMCG